MPWLISSVASLNYTLHALSMKEANKWSWSKIYAHGYAYFLL